MDINVNSLLASKIHVFISFPWGLNTQTHSPLQGLLNCSFSCCFGFFAGGYLAGAGAFHLVAWWFKLGDAVLSCHFRLLKLLWFHHTVFVAVFLWVLTFSVTSTVVFNGGQCIHLVRFCVTSLSHLHYVQGLLDYVCIYWNVSQKRLTKEWFLKVIWCFLLSADFSSLYGNTVVSSIHSLNFKFTLFIYICMKEARYCYFTFPKRSCGDKGCDAPW